MCKISKEWFGGFQADLYRKNKEPRAKSHEPRAKNKEQRHKK